MAGISTTQIFAAPTISNGGVLDLNGTLQTPNNGTLSLNNGQINNGLASSSGTWNAAVALGSSGGSMGGPGSLTVSGIISGTNDALTKTGTGMLTLGGVNTYTGSTTITAGTLAMGAAGSISASSAIAVNNGGNLTFLRSDTWGNAGGSTASSPITIYSGGLVASSSGYFNTIWNLALSGGTLLSNGGNSAQFGSFGLAGTVSAAGGVASSIATGAGTYNTINLGSGTLATPTTTTFNVGSGGTLSVGTPLQDHWYFITSNVLVPGALTENRQRTSDSGRQQHLQRQHHDQRRHAPGRQRQYGLPRQQRQLRRGYPQQQHAGRQHGQRADLQRHHLRHGKSVPIRRQPDDPHRQRHLYGHDHHLHRHAGHRRLGVPGHQHRRQLCL